MKWYGSITNRIEENHQYCDEIKVGDGVTEYHWSDRDAYEVVAVRDQKHITIREYDHESIGEPFSNNWKLISNPDNYEIALTKRGKYWYTSTTLTREELLKHLGDDGKLHLNDDNFNDVFWMSYFDFDKVLKSGKQTRYNKRNISIGVADYYYDYSF